MSTQIIGEVRQAKTTAWVVDGVAAKEIMNLPAGAMSLAVGFQYQSQKYNDNPSPILSSADIIGGAGEQLAGCGRPRCVLAVRRTVDPDHQEPRCAGGRALGRLQRLRQQRVAEGRRPLAAEQRAAGPWFVRPGFPRSDDPGPGGAAGADELGWCSTTTRGTRPRRRAAARCDVSFNPLYCGAQLSVTNSGNKSLQPETSNQWSVGFVLEPTRDFSVGVDFWWIQPEGPDRIPGRRRDHRELYRQLRCGGAELQRQPVLQSRAHPRQASPTVGAITVMDTAFNQIQNIADQNTNGVDIEAKLRVPQTGFGDLTFTYNATYIFQQEQKLTFIPGQEWQSTVGTYAIFGPVQRYRHYLAGTWNNGPWTVTLGNNYSSGYEDEYLNADLTVRNVAAWATWDLYARWTGVKNLALVAGITNLFNNPPPTTNQTDYFQVGYDPTRREPAGPCVLPDGAIQVLLKQSGSYPQEPGVAPGLFFACCHRHSHSANPHARSDPEKARARPKPGSVLKRGLIECPSRATPRDRAQRAARAAPQLTGVARTVTRSSAITWVDALSSCGCMPATVAPSTTLLVDHGHGQCGQAGAQGQAEVGGVHRSVLSVLRCRWTHCRQPTAPVRAHCDRLQKSRRELQRPFRRSDADSSRSSAAAAVRRRWRRFTPFFGPLHGGSASRRTRSASNGRRTAPICRQRHQAVVGGKLFARSTQRSEGQPRLPAD